MGAMPPSGDSRVERCSSGLTPRGTGETASAPLSLVLLFRRNRSRAIPTGRAGHAPTTGTRALKVVKFVITPAIAPQASKVLAPVCIAMQLLASSFLVDCGAL